MGRGDVYMDTEGEGGREKAREDYEKVCVCVCQRNKCVYVLER